MEDAALILGASGWIFGIFGILRNSKNDNAEDVKTTTQILTKLDGVNESLLEIKKRLNTGDVDIRRILERLSAFEKDIELLKKKDYIKK